MDLVFIHGAADSASVWDRQVERLGHRHRLLAVDLPGHGARLRELALDRFEDSAGDVLDQMRARDLRAPVLVGHSMAAPSR